jgi:hypothetical protein
VNSRNAANTYRTQLKLLDEDGTGGDECAAEHQGADDAEEQHAVLELPRDGEVGEDDRPDEDVVDGERLLDQIAGEVLLTELGAVQPPDADAERDAERDPDHGPGSCFATSMTCARRCANRSIASMTTMTASTASQPHNGTFKAYSSGQDLNRRSLPAQNGPAPPGDPDAGRP